MQHLTRTAAEAALVDFVNDNWKDETTDESPVDTDELAAGILKTSRSRTR
jgi:hypothetical protein